MPLAEGVAQSIEIAVQLPDNVFALACIVLVEAAAVLNERAVLLFDDQNPAGGIDDDEIDLAEIRTVTVDASPVDTVIDEKFRRELAPEQQEGLALAVMCPGETEIRNRRDKSGHALGPAQYPGGGWKPPKWRSIRRAVWMQALSPR